MKKMIALLVAVLMVFSICACKKQEVNSTNNTATTDETTSSNETEKPVAITLDDVKNVFLNDKNFEDCEITDCVLASDNAYGLTGVIQYTDADGNPSWLAFVDKDTAHPVGLDADNKLVIKSDSILTYIGNGTVALTLENPKTGEVYDYTMTYSYDEATNHTSFTAASSTRK